MSDTIDRIYKDITLDLYNIKASDVRVSAMQSDAASRYIRTYFTADGNTYAVDEDAHVQLYAVKPDGYAVYKNGEITDGAVIFELDSQILATPGTVTAQVIIYDQNYEQVIRSATPLMIDVAAKIDDLEALESTNEYSALEDMYQHIDQAIHTDNNFTNAYRQKLDDLDINAEPNQNAFSNVAVGEDVITASSKTGTFGLEAGNNITLVPNTESGVITISAADSEVPEIPYASDDADGILHAYDYTKLNDIAENALRITATDGDSITVCDANDSPRTAKLPIYEGIKETLFNLIYPVGSLYKRNRAGFPSLGTWVLHDLELLPYDNVYTQTISGRTINAYIKVAGHAVHIDFEIPLGNIISGTHSSGSTVLMTMPSLAAHVSYLSEDTDAFVPGVIYFPSGSSLYALFSISTDKNPEISIIKWSGSITSTDGIAYFSYDCIVPRSNMLAQYIYVYRRTE